MDSLIGGLIVLAAGGGAALALARWSRLANGVGAATAVVGSLWAMMPGIEVVVSGTAESVYSRPWSVPYGSFTLGLDALSAWFVVPILGLSALGALYGSRYLLDCAERKLLGASWFFYNLLVASMVLVVTARNGVLFLVAWETMALASYFLVVFEHEKQAVRDAGRTYLIASHLGTAFLLALFVLLGRGADSLDFARIDQWLGASGGFAPGAAGLLFVLAVVGFGTKAGFMPLHVWLPEAHPAAPSHVSAVMSGVMIKTGIYGLLRTLTFLGSPQPWWGWLLVAIGVTSAVLGVLFALAQHDLKRLLAYSTVENVGIIAIGLGAGLVGTALNEPGIAALGFAGALLHVVNHAVFKGLLFLSAGAAIHATGTGDMDALGGLLRRMPVTGAAFLIGAVAISALPPLNGFVSEFLIYRGAFEGAAMPSARISVPALAIIGSLALVGALAAACFLKGFGVVFLGEARSDSARDAHAAPGLMQWPMLVLAGGCFLIALFALPIARASAAAVATVSRQTPFGVAAELEEALAPLSSVVLVSAAVLLVAGLLAGVRKALLSGREVGSSPTWDCGFARPSARMQYTSSSFAQPLTDFFAPVLRTRKKLRAPQGLFPAAASYHTHTPDVAMESVYRAVFVRMSCMVSRLSWIQHGRVNLYVLYIAATLVVLLVWYAQ
jgi:formate hydrogenlyase subunit 3/multisubunit Na+/H+ antiporter MnhD subunit